MAKFRVALVTEIELSGRFADVDPDWIRWVVPKEIESYIPRTGMEFGRTTVVKVEEVKGDG